MCVPTCVTKARGARCDNPDVVVGQSPHPELYVCQVGAWIWTSAQNGPGRRWQLIRHARASLLPLRGGVCATRLCLPRAGVPAKGHEGGMCGGSDGVYFV